MWDMDDILSKSLVSLGLFMICLATPKRLQASALPTELKSLGNETNLAVFLIARGNEMNSSSSAALFPFKRNQDFAILR
jgi:hypothetical protein